MKLSPEALRLLRQAAAEIGGDSTAYLVGGAVRDTRLGRPLKELDIAVPKARSAAARLAKAWKATLVTLDADHEIYRVVLRKPQRIGHVDVSQIQGKDIAADLARRDFTINAIALPLSPTLSASVPDSALLDPRGGLDDLKRGLIRAESVKPFEEDPLRILRAFRLAAQLGLRIDDKTLTYLSAVRHRVRRPAGERIQAELLALLSVPGASRWLRLMDSCSVLTALFEDMEPSRTCAETYYGPGGVMTHSLDTVDRMDFLLDNLKRSLPGVSGKVADHIAARTTATVSHRSILMLSAFLHDVAKPFTARQVDGRLRFFGHDTEGARLAGNLLKKLRFSRSDIDTVSTIIAHHLRPGNLAANGIPTDKAVYRFFRDVGPDAVSLLLVCWADHASYLGPKRLEKFLKDSSRDPRRFDISALRPADVRKTISHLQIINFLLRRWFTEPKKSQPEKLIDGKDVMKTLGIKAGPLVGELLEAVREAQVEGKVSDQKEALALLTRLKPQ